MNYRRICENINIKRHQKGCTKRKRKPYNSKIISILTDDSKLTGFYDFRRYLKCDNLTRRYNYVKTRSSTYNVRTTARLIDPHAEHTFAS